MKFVYRIDCNKAIPLICSSFIRRPYEWLSSLILDVHTCRSEGSASDTIKFVSTVDMAMKIRKQQSPSLEASSPSGVSAVSRTLATALRINRPPERPQSHSYVSEPSIYLSPRRNGQNEWNERYYQVSCSSHKGRGNAETASIGTDLSSTDLSGARTRAVRDGGSCPVVAHTRIYTWY